MFRNPKRFHRIALLVVIQAGLLVASLPAQGAPKRPWTVTAAFTGLWVGATQGVAYGPELAIRRDFGPRWGVGLRASLPVLGTDQGAAAIDLGPTVTFAANRAEFGLSAGATGFLVGDQSEFIDGGVGAFVSGHGTAWLTPSLGATAGAEARILGGGAVYPSLSVGLAVRF